MWAKQILDWFIHPDLKQSTLIHSYANTIASTGIIAAGAVPLFTSVYYLLGHTSGALACALIGFSILSALAVLKFFGYINFAREIILSALYLGLVWLSYTQGGLITPATYWLLLPPIVAVFLGGSRASIRWLLICALTVMGFLIAHKAHVIFPPTLIIDIELLTAISIIGLTGVILVLVYYFELAKIEGFRELEKAASIIEEKGNALIKANQELNQLASRTNTILAAAADGIIATNKQGIIETYNRAIKDMFGYDMKELEDQNLQVLFSHPNVSMKAPPDRFFSLTHILSTETALHELVGFRKDGTSFPLELAVSRIDSNEFKTFYICAIRDITERKKAEERLAYIAHYDHLTGLPNRILYEILLNKAILRAKNSGKFCALLYLDLDYFKNVNDTLGHDIGDLLLKEAASRIANCLREGATLSRLGGDEFTIILDEIAEITYAAKTAQLILDKLSPPFILNGYEIFTSASIGIAIFPSNGQDVTTLAKNADIALYNAKEKGRRNYQFFNEELNSQNLSRIALENNLHNALRLNELQLHYQPQIDIKTGQLIGLEALLRWHNPALGAVAPDIFIPIAEKTGLIVPIGEWVLKTACQQFKSWHTAGLLNSASKMAINLSSVQLTQENLPLIISQILKDNQISHQNIELELTETAIMRDQATAISTLQQLDKLGFCIAIDDFGTGYSSLSYLKCLPVHTLKIDKSFIRDLVSDKNDALIIKAIIALGHGLELQVLAEGVETEAQLTYLQQNGCDQVQGYFISAPLSVQNMTAFLNSRIQP